MRGQEVERGSPLDVARNFERVEGNAAVVRQLARRGSFYETARPGREIEYACGVVRDFKLTFHRHAGLYRYCIQWPLL